MLSFCFPFSSFFFYSTTAYTHSRSCIRGGPSRVFPTVKSSDTHTFSFNDFFFSVHPLFLFVVAVFCVTHVTSSHCIRVFARTPNAFSLWAGEFAQSIFARRFTRLMKPDRCRLQCNNAFYRFPSQRGAIFPIENWCLEPDMKNKLRKLTERRTAVN